MPEPFDDDRLDDLPEPWGVEGPAFARRPAAVESLRDELARYAGRREPATVAGATAHVDASRRSDP